MKKPLSSRDRQMRELIAQEAARLIATGGMRDFLAAKRKAAAHLGAPDTRNMPRNQEIEEALATYQRLFQGAERLDRLQVLRKAALEAMRFFEGFEPRLTGSALSGTAGQHSDVNLHLFAATPEEVILRLLDAEIPFEDDERRFRFGSEERIAYPLVRFLAGDVTIEAVIFPREGLREAPRSPRDGKPMQRASLRQLETLLAPTPE